MALDVLIPHYRDLDGFTASLNSIIEQTWSGDIRLVVVDDGSPEKEFLALQKRLEEQPLPFHLERNDVNRGRPFTRNRLLDCIDNEYVAWQDAGDLWYPEKIARQFEHINRLRFAGENTDNVWITCDYDWRRDGGRCYLVEQDVTGDQLRSLILGEALRAHGLPYVALDFSYANYQHALLKKAILEQLRASFEAEGNSFLFENRYAEARGVIRAFEAGMAVRYLYHVCNRP